MRSSRFAKLIVLLVLPGQFAAHADEIQVSLDTYGSFSSVTPNLNFQGVTGITGTTVGGSVVLEGLGIFTLQKPLKAADHYTGFFTLEVNFGSADGLSEGRMDYDGTLSGTVNTQLGSVMIDFGPARALMFKNQLQQGSFNFSVDDLTLAIPHEETSSVSVNLIARITDAIDPPVNTPEPASIFLLGTLIGAVVFVSRRWAPKAIVDSASSRHQWLR